jgi:tetratricopeptide (TPR) repeat protein
MNQLVQEPPNDLRPVVFLWDVENRLEARCREAVERCKRVAEGNDPKRIAKEIQEAEMLWCRHGEGLGRSVAFVYLADWYWRNGRHKNVQQCCRKALEHIPDGPPPAYTTAKAAASYLLGLSLQASNNLPAASDEYHAALEFFQATQHYWQRVGRGDRVERLDEVLEYIRGLVEQLYELSKASAAQPEAPPPDEKSASTSPSAPPVQEEARPHPRPAYWAEFTQLPALGKPIPAGAPRDLSGLAHVNAAIHQLIIHDQVYELRSPRQDRRRVLFAADHLYVIVPVQGDSMNQADIVEGDMVALQLLDEGDVAVNNDIVAAQVRGDDLVTLKQYAETGGRRYLRARSSNPDWQDYEIEINDDVWIRGVVVAILKPVSHEG